MNYYQRPTPLHEQANIEAIQHFAEPLKQFKANCDALHGIESNLAETANDAARAALQSSGCIIQTDDGTQWQYNWIRSIRNEPSSILETVLRVASYQPASCKRSAKKSCVQSSWSRFLLTSRPMKFRCFISSRSNFSVIVNASLTKLFPQKINYRICL
jgi:hypothetical protein